LWAKGVTDLAVHFLPITTLVMQVIAEPLTLPAHLKRAVDEHWDAEGEGFFRGLVLSVTSIVQRSEKLNVQLVCSDYAHYLYTTRHRLTGQNALRAAYTSCLLRTNDGQFVIAEMGGATQTPGRLQLPGGNIDQNDIGAQGSVDVAGSIAREMLEELGLNLDALLSIPLKPSHLKIGGTYDFVGMMFLVDLPWSAAEVQAHFEAHSASQQPPELSALVFVPATPEAVQIFFGQDPRARVDYLEPYLSLIAANQS
jgi:8-oxo-dGTP pyrophosphatase MutT (NUDIX family)